MDEQRWFNREHVIRTRDGIDLHSDIEPMSGSAWFGNKDKKGEKTARLTLYFNEASCGMCSETTTPSTGFPSLR